MRPFSAGVGLRGPGKLPVLSDDWRLRPPEGPPAAEASRLPWTGRSTAWRSGRLWPLTASTRARLAQRNEGFHGTDKPPSASGGGGGGCFGLSEKLPSFRGISGVDLKSQLPHLDQRWDLGQRVTTSLKLLGVSHISQPWSHKTDLQGPSPAREEGQAQGFANSECNGTSNFNASVKLGARRNPSLPLKTPEHHSGKKSHLFHVPESSGPGSYS